VLSANQITKGMAVKQDGVIHTVFGGTTNSEDWISFLDTDIVPDFTGVNWINGSQITFGFYDAVGTSDTPFTLEAFLKTPLAVARLRRSWDIVA